jgi:hypothetical protein
MEFDGGCEAMAESSWHRGQLVEVDGLLAVVVGTDADASVPAGNVVVWFGMPQATRTSQGGPGGSRPEVWTVPSDACIPAQEPVVRH